MPAAYDSADEKMGSCAGGSALSGCDHLQYLTKAYGLPDPSVRCESDVQLLIARPADYSFPSGHTAASFAAVAALYFAGARKWWKIMLPLAILMAFSRMYLYVHYPTDVLGGMIVGCAAGYFGNRLAAHLIRSWRQKMKKPEDRKNR